MIKSTSQVTLVNEDTIIPLKQTFNASMSDLKGADSPNTYKDILSRNSSSSTLTEKKPPEAAVTESKEKVTEAAEKHEEVIEIPVLRGPESPLAYARYK